MRKGLILASLPLICLFSLIIMAALPYQEECTTSLHHAQDIFPGKTVENCNSEAHPAKAFFMAISFLSGTTFAVLIYYYYTKSITISVQKSRKQKQENEKKQMEIKLNEARNLENYKDYDKAIEIWDELQKYSEVKRLTKVKALHLENLNEHDLAIKCWEVLNSEDEIIRVLKEKAKFLVKNKNYDSAINIWEKLGNENEVLSIMKMKANEREIAKDYDSAIRIWEEVGEIKDAARVRTLKAEQGSVKVAQKVVHGDEISKTEINDSVLNRSNVGGGSSKAEKLREAKALLDEGVIDDDEFKQMKKEILE